MDGHLTDSDGRCTHYSGPRDIVGNKCSICGRWWACFRCHEELMDHPFGKMLIDAPDSTLCGACGELMSYGHEKCPQCGHLFNPGCSLHAHIYFEF